MEYAVFYPTPLEEFDPHDDNMDVCVTFADGQTCTFVFATPQNLVRQMAGEGKPYLEPGLPMLIVEELTELGVDGVGLNCSLGPVDALPIIREFAEQTDLPLVFKPNAGKPVLGEDGSVISPYSAEDFANDVAPVLELVTYLGGCCGSSPEYISVLKKKIQA